MKTYRYKIDGRSYEVTVNSVTGRKAEVTVNGVAYSVDIEGNDGKSVRAPLPGLITEILVAPGEVVKEGQPLAVLSEYAGVVSEVCVSVGETVPFDAVIVIID